MTPEVTKPLPGTTIDPTCPDSDGMPMGETDFHINAIICLRLMLQHHFREHPDVYVASNMLLYHESRHGTRNRRDPDVFVVKGVGKHFRRSFRTWEEKTVPCVVFEVSSEKTWETDYYDKRDDYRRFGVAEYFLFDPETKYLNPPLQGYRLNEGDYEPIPRDRDGSLVSEQLRLRLIAEGNILRLIDLATNIPLLTPDERAHEEADRAEEERQRAEEERQRAEEQQQRAEEERQRAEEQQQRAEKQQQRAEEEHRRNLELTAELEKLRHQLEEKRNGTRP